MLAASLAMLVGLCASAASAQESSRGHDEAHATATARALFDAGVACVDRADWACAVEQFGRARALRASPVIVSNLAIALAHAGRLVEASESYRALARDGSAPDELRAAAAQAITELAARIGRITVHAAGSIDDIAIAMDGTNLAVSSVDVPLPSDPGEHVVEARRQGTLVASAHVHLEPGASVGVELAIPARPVSPSAARPSLSLVAPDPDASMLGAGALSEGSTSSPEHHELYEEWWLWAIVGVVVVGAGVGITAGVVGSQGTTLPAGSLGTIDARL